LWCAAAQFLRDLGPRDPGDGPAGGLALHTVQRGEPPGANDLSSEGRTTMPRSVGLSSGGRGAAGSTSTESALAPLNFTDSSDNSDTTFTW
jgi:hypothetical protein